MANIYGRNYRGKKCIFCPTRIKFPYGDFPMCSKCFHKIYKMCIVCETVGLEWKMYKYKRKYFCSTECVEVW